MRDFIAHVRRHLPSSGIPAARHAEIVEELASELEARYTALVQRGASDADAWQEILAQIPSWPTLAQDLGAGEHSRPSPWPWLTSRARFGSRPSDRWRRDVRHGARGLWKERGFALTAIATLAVCLGGHAAIVAGVNALLLHPLRVPQPERVVLMANQYPRMEARRGTVSATPDYDDRRAAVTVLEAQALYNYSAANIESDGTPARITGIVATPSLFRLLRVRPAYGRLFTEAEGTAGNDQRVILSHGLWRQLYAGDPAVIGQTVRLTDREFTIVGILPPEFSFGGADVRFWIPLALTDRQRSDDARHNNGWFSIGRLKAGATIEQARAQLQALDAVNRERLPPQLRQLLVNAGFYTSVEPLQDTIVRDVKTPLILLWTAAVAVLVIGAANVANLALVRSRLRLGEMGTRLAIGAGRFDLVRQLLVEGLLISLAGATAGLLLAAWIVSALRTTDLTAVRDLSSVHIDAFVIAITLGLGVLVGIAVGLTSSLPLYMPLPAILSEQTRTRGRGARVRRRTLVVAQMACSFVLLAGTGLLWASVRNLLTVNPGFRTGDVLTGVLSLPRESYASDEAARAFMRDSLDAIRRLPSVAAAGATTIVPLRGNTQTGIILAEGYVPKPGETAVSGLRVTVTPGYFEAVGTPLVRGRYFDERDTAASTTSIVIDERLARRFWPDRDPLGRRLFRPANARETTPDDKTRWMTVIGVVRNAQLTGPEAADDTSGTYYLPYAATAPRDFGYVIRARTDPASIVHDVRRAVAGIERQAPLFDVRTLSERANLSLVLRTSTLQLAAIFALVALLLSALGLYGMLAYLVTQRAREIGVRMAIGSTPRGIVGLILGEGLTLAAVGIVLGAIGVLAIRRVLASQLYGVDASDPWVMMLVTLALATVAAAACVYPARRAAHVDIVKTLSAR